MHNFKCFLFQIFFFLKQVQYSGVSENCKVLNCCQVLLSELYISICLWITAIENVLDHIKPLWSRGSLKHPVSPPKSYYETRKTIARLWSERRSTGLQRWLWSRQCCQENWGDSVSGSVNEMIQHSGREKKKKMTCLAFKHCGQRNKSILERIRKKYRETGCQQQQGNKPNAD